MKLHDAASLLKEYRDAVRRTLFFENLIQRFESSGQSRSAGCNAARRNLSKAQDEEYEIQTRMVRALTRTKN